MTLVLTEEQQQLRDTVRGLVSERAPLSWRRSLRDAGQTHDPELWGLLVELGAPGILVSEAQDGLGLGLVELTTVMEALGRHDPPTPLLSSVLAARLMEDARTVAAGEIVALAWREHPRSADPQQVKTFATGTRSEFRLHGRKCAVLDATHATRFLVTAKDVNGALGVYEVNADAPGLHRAPLTRIDHRDVADLRFEGCLAHRIDGAAACLDDALDHGRIALAAELLGLTESAFSMTRAFLVEREQFDRKIGSFQAIQHRAVDCYARLVQARAVVLAAALEPGPASAALALCWTAESALHIGQEAIQLHGGIGMTDEHDVGFFLKRTRVAAETFGPPSEQRRRWAAAHGY